jgi:hypothetical protein
VNATTVVFSLALFLKGSHGELKIINHEKANLNYIMCCIVCSNFVCAGHNQDKNSSKSGTAGASAKAAV